MKKTTIAMTAAFAATGLVAAIAFAAQPGVPSLVVNAPNALTIQTQFVWDGGSGSAPPVQIFPVVAPSYHILSGGVVEAMIGQDGGQVSGLLYHERGQILAAAGLNQTNLFRSYVTPPQCLCSVAGSIAAGSASTVQISYWPTLCATAADAGIVPAAQNDAGPVTTLWMGVIDGGIYDYDCIGY